MRQVFAVVLACLVIFSYSLCSASGFASRVRVPEVSCREPANDSNVDLTGKSVLTFSWDMVPIPAGGRELYKFTLYKGDGYEVVVSEKVDPRTFSTDVPTDKFEVGVRYRWSVKQRDSRSLEWSHPNDMFFTVIKK